MKICNVGVVEGALRGIQFANSLIGLEKRGEFLVQCVNPSSETVELPAGLLIEIFHSVQEKDVGPVMETADETLGVPTTNDRGPVPKHLVYLHGNAGDACESNSTCWVVLLFAFKDLFSCDVHDMSLTKAVRHELSLAGGMVPIWQPT